jgi:hypothetical protein
MKNTKVPRISPGKRLLYAFVSLLAGDLILLFFLLQHAPRDPAHGENLLHDCNTVQTFTLYAIFSFVGWVFVGLRNVVPGGLDLRLSAASADFGRYFCDRSAYDLRTTQSKSHLLTNRWKWYAALIQFWNDRFFYGLLALLQGNESNPIQSRRSFRLS